MKHLFFLKLHVLHTLSCLCAPSFQRHMFISRHMLVCRRCYSHECIGIQAFLKSSSCSHAFMGSVQDEGGRPRFLATFVQAASEQYTANLPQDPLAPARLELRPSRQQPAMVKIQNKGPFLKKHAEKVQSRAKFLKKHGEKPNNMSRDDKTMSDLMKRLHIDQADIVFFYLAI